MRHGLNWNEGKEFQLKYKLLGSFSVSISLFHYLGAVRWGRRNGRGHVL